MFKPVKTKDDGVAHGDYSKWKSFGMGSNVYTGDDFLSDQPGGNQAIIYCHDGNWSLEGAASKSVTRREFIGDA